MMGVSIKRISKPVTWKEDELAHRLKWGDPHEVDASLDQDKDPSKGRKEEEEGIVAADKGGPKRTEGEEGSTIPPSRLN